jgi:hypothetical protein
MIATTLSGLKFQLRFAEYQLTLATNKDFYQSLIITYKEAIAKLEKK